MLVALYKREQVNMQYSEGNGRLFVAKLVFCLLIWIWLLPILGILENNLHWIEISFDKPKSRIGYLPVPLLIYFILNHFTWKLKDVDEYLAGKDNSENIRRAKRLFFILLVLGFVALVGVAKYNQGDTLSD